MSNRFKPGEPVAHPGMYRMTHAPAHRQAEDVYLTGRDIFPVCAECDEPTYDLVLLADVSKVSKARQFFDDLELAFHRQFGRELTFEERWFLQLAERAVMTAEHLKDERPLVSSSIPTSL